MSRYTRWVLALTVTSVVLVLFMTAGSVFPSRWSIPEAGEALPDEFYDYSAKSSPFDIPETTRKKAKTKPPLISARTLPLLTLTKADPMRMTYSEGPASALETSAANRDTTQSSSIAMLDAGGVD